MQNEPASKDYPSGIANIEVKSSTALDALLNNHVDQLLRQTKNVSAVYAYHQTVNVRSVPGRALYDRLRHGGKVERALVVKCERTDGE